MVLNIVAIVVGIAVMYGVLFISGVAILMILQYYSYSYYLFQIMDIVSVILTIVLLVASVVLGFAVAKKIVDKSEKKWALKGYCIAVMVFSLYEFMNDLSAAGNFVNRTEALYSVGFPLLMAATAAYLLLRNTKQSR